MALHLPSTSSLSLPNPAFRSKLNVTAKFKQRSYNTYHTVHLPELNTRLGLNLNLVLSKPSTEDPFTCPPDLTNISKIQVLYLGNSMLERLKTTGKNTRLGILEAAWNAGCGGDKNENVLFRLADGMYDILEHQSSDGNGSGNLDLKVWLLASGTNNLRPKAPFRDSDVASWRLLVEACLRIAPRSKVIACDMFYRNDVPDRIVDESNDMLKEVVGDVNRELVGKGDEERIVWVDGRHRIGKDALVDHVHLDERGYAIWDELLYNIVERELERVEGDESGGGLLECSSGP
ncbi:hypothetical protein CC78DRAFT_535081 [Lojkania enalia]|uniref:SGNH hydrolase-type esterase domain-containing protein n=1 Tax=Lojkania enalia TaxID=147567 RepID=A0A9P4N1Y9_9PLEO|nr:hypothetical protein CC78DRAFT_535081 [Didymosphaeria enalia]